MGAIIFDVPNLSDAPETGSTAKTGPWDTIDIDNSPAGRAIRKAYGRPCPARSRGHNSHHDSVMLATGLDRYKVPVAVVPVAALE